MLVSAHIGSVVGVKRGVGAFRAILGMITRRRMGGI
jgi:hypothetical protein